MLSSPWAIAAICLFAPCFFLGSFFSWRRFRRIGEEAYLADARRVFRKQREWLEADFVKLASNSGKPRGLDWVDCDFADEIAFARDRSTRELKALVAVTIRFEAIAGGDMEDVEAVSDLRAATAVFRFQNQRWTTDGRALFNLNPSEAIRHFRHDLETVD